MEQPRRLYRSEDDRMLAGICSTVHRSLTTGSSAFEPSVVMLSPPVRSFSYGGRSGRRSVTADADEPVDECPSALGESGPTTLSAPDRQCLDQARGADRSSDSETSTPSDAACCCVPVGSLL